MSLTGVELLDLTIRLYKTIAPFTNKLKGYPENCLALTSDAANAAAREADKFFAEKARKEKQQQTTVVGESQKKGS